MKTRLLREGDTVVLNVDGTLDMEAQEPLRDNLSRLVSRSKTDSIPLKIIVNLENLEFVGSSGISKFVQTLKEFNSRSPIRPRYCNVKTEFQRIIKAFDEENQFEFFDTIQNAKRSFDN